MGFEPTEAIKPQHFSKVAQSTALATFRKIGLEGLEPSPGESQSPMRNQIHHSPRFEMVDVGGIEPPFPTNIH